MLYKIKFFNKHISQKNYSDLSKVENIIERLQAIFGKENISLIEVESD